MVWPELKGVRFEDDRLVLSPLTVLDEPAGTSDTRKGLHTLVPKRKIAQWLREAQN